MKKKHTADHSSRVLVRVKFNVERRGSCVTRKRIEKVKENWKIKAKPRSNAYVFSNVISSIVDSMDMTRIHRANC